jgi:hypothetical protein
MATYQDSSPNAYYSEFLAEYQNLASRLKQERDSCKQILNQYLEIFEPFSWNLNNPSQGNEKYFWKDIDLYKLLIIHSLVVQNTYPIDIGVQYPLRENFDILAFPVKYYVMQFIFMRNGDALQDKFPYPEAKQFEDRLDYLIVEFIYHSMKAGKLYKRSIRNDVPEYATYVKQLKKFKLTSLIQEFGIEFQQHFREIT